MRSLILRWIGLAACLALLAWAFVNLGFWQLDRLDQRRSLNTSVQTHEGAPVVAWEAALAATVDDTGAWQRVSATGVFDAEHQFVIRYRSQGGLTGYEVVTPLRTAQGTVLVDRGFAQRPAGEDFPTLAPPPPGGQITLVGYVRRGEQGDDTAVVPVDGQVRLINPTALAASLPYPVATTGFLSAISLDPPASAGLTPVTPPQLNEGNHFSYALQWFAFAALAVIGLVVFIRADLRDRRRAAARKAARAGTATAAAE